MAFGDPEPGHAARHGLARAILRTPWGSSGWWALVLRQFGRSGNVRGLVLALGLAYYRLSGGSAALAAMGLIAFAGVAQVLPALIGGIFWRGATKAGALAGLMTGFVVWGWTLFLPSFGDAVLSGWFRCWRTRYRSGASCPCWSGPTGTCRCRHARRPRRPPR